MRFVSGIRSQLIIGITVATLAGIGLIGVFSIKIVENNAVLRKVREAEVVTSFIRTAVPRAMVPGEKSKVVELISGVLSDVGIGDFIIKDRSGNILVMEGNLPEGKGETIFFKQGIKVSRYGGGWLKGPGGMLYISAYLSADAVGGEKEAVRFTMSLADVREDMAGIRRFLLSYAVVDSIIIIALGVYLLSRGIIGPIKDLETAATRIAGGRLGERAPVVSDNEIGSLAVSFNTMAERLEEEIKRLDRINKELVSAQEELLRSSTLAAVGRLAAGFAHEIGNPLGAIRGYLDILLKGLDEKDEEEEIIKRVDKEVQRINSIVRDFLELARPAKKPSGPVDVNRLLKETLSTLEVHRSFNGVKTTMMLKQGIPPAAIDEGKLRQVFINILLNAAEVLSAAPEGKSEVTIKTGLGKKLSEQGKRSSRRKQDPVFVPQETAKSYVVVSIADTGPGMSEEDLRKVFEPFYTTKEPGKGTGLGLFISQSIIRAYGGEIVVKTRRGEGSTFSIHLPQG